MTVQEVARAIVPDRALVFKGIWIVQEESSRQQFGIDELLEDILLFRWRRGACSNVVHV